MCIYFVINNVKDKYFLTEWIWNVMPRVEGLCTTGPCIQDLFILIINLYEILLRMQYCDDGTSSLQD